MKLLMPYWLILIIPAAVLITRRRFSSNALLVLRVFVMILIILCLCRPALKLKTPQATVVAICDLSDSMPEASEKSQIEAINIIRSAMKKDHYLATVSFGAKPAIEMPPSLKQAGKFTEFIHETGKDQSGLALALKTALSLIPPESPGRIIIFSDGKYTGQDPVKEAAKARTRSIPIDYRLFGRGLKKDTAIFDFSGPDDIPKGRSFIIKAEIMTGPAKKIKYRLFRGKTLISSGEKAADGKNIRLFFRDMANKAGVYSYMLYVAGDEKDPLPENNKARLLVNIKGRLPVLLVNSQGKSALKNSIEKGGFEVKNIKADFFSPSLENLSSYQAVVLENIPAQAMGREGMENLRAWVHDGSGGIVMTGGENSFGPGGYFKSPLEKILPVSMEMRKEQHKLKTALVIALDRSGSMGAMVEGGRTKMDLANEGAVSVLDLLMPSDEFGLIAVDSKAHKIIKLIKAENAVSFRGKILSIDSGGGGIFVYEALIESVRMLEKSAAPIRHIILFADAADSEEPGKYKELLDKCVKSNITVSVIGLGSPTDRDGELLKDIGGLGKGRCFFATHPLDIPRLFVQDTFMVTRRAFIEKPTPVKFSPAIYGIFPKGIGEKIPHIGGYNLCYIKPGADLGIISLDKYKAPIMAFWQAGEGRTLCYTGEADGKFTGPFGKWDKAGDIFAGTVRWVAKEQTGLPSDMLITKRLEKGILNIRLELDPERKKEIIKTLPVAIVLRSSPGKKPVTESKKMVWTSPDALELDLPVSGKEIVLPAIKIPDLDRVIRLSPSCLPYSPEYEPTPENAGKKELEKLSEITGGKQRADLGAIWDEMPVKSGLKEIGPLLALGAVIFFLLEIFERRTGFLANFTSKRNFKVKRKKSKDKKTKDHPARPGKEKPKKKTFEHSKRKEENPPIKPDATDALAKAKRIAKQRMKR